MPWLGGQIVLGALGRYGGHNVMPAWVDIGVVIAFSLAIFYLSLSLTLSTAEAAAAVAKDARQIEYDSAGSAAA